MKRWIIVLLAAMLTVLRTGAFAESDDEIRHYTVCTPLRAFLEETDLSAKTLYVMTTHCGSRFADTIEKIQQLQPNAAVIRCVAVSGFDPDSSETEVREFVRSTIE